MNHPLNHRQQIFHAMREFGHQQLLARLQRLAVGDVACAFEHIPATIHRHQLSLAFHDQTTAVLGDMVQFTFPSSLLQQFLSNGIE